jgi:hypothetical protein
MRDTKSILLLIVSFLLLLVSCALLWTWGYRVYNEKQTVQQQEPIAEPSAKQADPGIITASFNNAPAQGIDSIWSSADSLKGELDVKINEFNRLRNEINTILKDTRGNTDLDMARQKISALQQVVDMLRNKNKDVESENKRLQSVLQQLSAYMKSPDPQAKRVGYEEKISPDNNTNAAAFVASDLKLAAVMTSNDKEEETTQAQQTEKLVGSFNVRSNSTLGNNSEVLVVIIKPDGQVLKGSAWESGIFNTPEGKKIYSYKLRLDLTRGEVRRLLFTLASDNYQKGNYTMQLYFNGAMIGRLSKTLS